MGLNGLHGGGPSRVGIVTGLIEEAQVFRPAEGTFNRACPFYCRDHGDVMLACAGIGKVNAAVAATHLIYHGCTALVSMGVAGALRGTEPGTYWVREAVQSDYGAYRDGAFAHYRAGVLPFGEPTFEAYKPIDLVGHGLASARILTGDYFLEDDEEAARLGGHLEGDLIDMETGAIAQVAAIAGVPWVGVRAVSDTAGRDSASDFQVNLAKAAKQSANATERIVRLLRAVGSTIERASDTPHRQRESSDLPDG